MLRPHKYITLLFTQKQHKYILHSKRKGTHSTLQAKVTQVHTKAAFLEKSSCDEPLFKYALIKLNKENKFQTRHSKHFSRSWESRV